MNFSLFTAVTPLLIALSIAAALLDIRSRRIPNALTISAMATALLLRSFFGWHALLDGFAGAGLAFALMFFLFAIGAMGGGDGKFMIAVGAFLGTDKLLIALAATALAGMLLSLVMMWRQGAVRVTLLNLQLVVLHWLSGGRKFERRTLESPGGLTVPYGVAIAVGAVVGCLV